LQWKVVGVYFSLRLVLAVVVSTIFLLMVLLLGLLSVRRKGR